MPFNSRNKLLYAGIALVVFLSALFKIADLDFWWHLKTGEIILQQKAFPYTEIYSFTAFGREYIDHEWLFQVIQYLTFHQFGDAGIIFLKCLVIAVIYLLIARFLLARGVSAGWTIGILLLSVCGARPRFIERPELFTVFFLVLSFTFIDDYLRNKKKAGLFFLPIIVMIWANTHAAVILGLLLQLAFIGGLLLERLLKGHYPAYYYAELKTIGTLFLVFILSLVFAGINPYGYRTLLVPFQLTAIIDSGLLDNQEWRRPSFTTFPFYYACLAVSIFFHAIHFRKLSLVNFCLALFFGYISLKYLRNVGLFCMMMPLLVAPYLSALSCKQNMEWLAACAAAAALVFVLFTDQIFEPGIGKASYFPVKIVDFTKSNHLRGHMINSYGFGGYLIWTLFPERKIFIDGRNEVYLPLLEKLVAARGDSRKWKKILEEYEIEYALLNYVDTLETVTVMTGNNPTITYAPFSSTHFPRSSWALVYWDDDGMILVNRKGVNQSLLSLEFTSIYPEGIHGEIFYQETLSRAGKLDSRKAIEELERKLREEPSCQRALRLLKAMRAVT